jgi:dienelactone hydrolase
MASIVAFHHALGLTPSVLAFAEDLRSAGHTVHTPDLFGGRTFSDVGEGVAHADEIGFDAIVTQASDAVDDLGTDVVYAGFSLGVVPAQKLAQARPGARGVVLFHGAVPSAAFGTPWPPGLPVQIHLKADDPWDDGDAEAAAALRDEVGDIAEVFVYPGSGHLFMESSHPDYDEEAASRALERTLAFLAMLG